MSEGHISLANIKFNYDWDWVGAEREFMRALQLDPGSLRVHSNYGFFLMALGRHDEAIREGQLAMELDPVSSDTQSALGRFFYRAHRFEEAVPYLQRAVELEPRTARVYALMGRKREALRLIRSVKEPPISIAAVYAALGDKDTAFRILEGAAARRNAHLVYLKEDPPLDSLHSDPRWSALLRRLNFPGQ